ncbi:MAG: hypothetical protein WCP58_03170, partial [bacterium]
ATYRSEVCRSIQLSYGSAPARLWQGFPLSPMIGFTRNPRRVEALSVGKGNPPLYHECLRQHLLPTNRQGSA